MNNAINKGIKNRIERLEEENKSLWEANERLKEALKRIADMKGHPYPDYELMQKIAKVALNQ